MAVYIKVDDAVEAFKKAEADDKADFIKYGIFDDNSTKFFPAERAIDIINNLPVYTKEDKITNMDWFNTNVDVDDRLSCFTALKCPPEYTYSCHHLMDGVDCEDCWYQWLNEEHYEPENEARY